MQQLIRRPGACRDPGQLNESLPCVALDPGFRRGDVVTGTGIVQEEKL